MYRRGHHHSGNCTLIKLDLFNNNIGAQGAGYVADIEVNCCALQEIHLSENSIGDAGTRLLAEALKD
jgi:hypothetical protein